MSEERGEQASRAPKHAAKYRKTPNGMILESLTHDMHNVLMYFEGVCLRMNKGDSRRRLQWQLENTDMWTELILPAML